MQEGILLSSPLFTDNMENKMNENLSLSEAENAMNKLSGSEGFKEFEKELENAIQARKAQLNIIQGEINAFTTMRRLVQSILGRIQSQPVVEKVASEIKKAVVEQEPQIDLQRELEERLKQNCCTYKAPKKDGGKWCERKLRTKVEKKSGYCKTHMTALGISEVSTDKE